MKSLLEFYNDKDTKENVKNYLIEYLRGEAVRKVFDKEDVSSVAEAKDIIDKAFENMDNMFAKKPIVRETKNESR
jgi:hypothetical protein